MVAVLFCSAGGTSSITWPGGKERHYKGGRIHREGGPAVVSKGTFEAWYQNGDPFRIGAGAFAQVMARAPPREKNKIADSRCAHIVMRSFHIYRQAWVRVGGISMLESFVFTFGYNPTETGVDYNAWCFVGETWGADCRTAIRDNVEFVRNTWGKNLSSADFLGWDLTIVFMNCMAAAPPIQFVCCMAYKTAPVRLWHLLPEFYWGRWYAGSFAGGLLCKPCAIRWWA